VRVSVWNTYYYVYCRPISRASVSEPKGSLMVVVEARPLHACKVVYIRSAYACILCGAVANEEGTDEETSVGVVEGFQAE